MNRRELANRAITLAGGVEGFSVNYDPLGYGDLVTETRWHLKKYSACQDLATRLTLEVCEMKRKMPCMNRVDGGNVWVPGINLIRIKQNAPYAWKQYSSTTPWDIRVGDAVEVINNYGPHTFVITEITYNQLGNPATVDTAEYGQFHAPGGKPAGASCRCYLGKVVSKTKLGWMINGCRIEGRLNMFSIREHELGIPESSPIASPVPLQPEPEFDLGTVSGIQKALNRLGASPLLKVDGVAGPKTKASVIAFQGRHSLKVDGIVGPNTLAALKAALEGVAP